MTRRPSDRLWTRWLLPSFVGALVVGLCSWGFIHYTNLNPFKTMDMIPQAKACPPGEVKLQSKPTPTPGRVSAGSFYYPELMTPWGRASTDESSLLSPLNMGQYVTENVGNVGTVKAEMRVFRLVTGDHSPITLPGLTENTFRCLTSVMVARGGRVDSSSTRPMKVKEFDALRLDAQITRKSKTGETSPATFILVVVEVSGSYYAFQAWADEKFKERLPAMEATIERLDFQ